MSTVDPEVAARIDRWARARTGGAMPAVVLGGSVNALSHLRSLGRRGVSLLVVDHAPRVATHSRYATPLVLGTPAGRFEAWPSVLERIGEQLPGPAVLLPTTDELVTMVAEHADELRRWYRFLVPDAATVAAIVNKARQYERARAAGIPIPRTHHVTSSDDLVAHAPGLTYPVLLKPQSDASRRAFGAKARPVDDADELLALFKEHDQPGVHFVVQELIPGSDEALYGYWAFWDANGHEHSWITRRKLRQYPIGFGSGSYQETLAAPDVAELSRRLLQAFDYRGLVGVEWKRDERDGGLRLMEINPRTVSGNQLAISAGVDLPWIAYRSLADPAAAPAPNHDFRVGVRWINEDLDPKAFRDLRRAGAITTLGWLRTLLATRSFAFWSWRDPKPFAQRFAGPLARAARQQVGRAVRRPAVRR
jgi:predicted ATP-grasp superfamily ATP-dependent carboligase